MFDWDRVNFHKKLGGDTADFFSDSPPHLAGDGKERVSSHMVLSCQQRLNNFGIILEFWNNQFYFGKKREEHQRKIKYNYMKS